MVRIEIVTSLVKEIKEKFNKQEANNIIDLIESVHEQPKKGKPLGAIGGILIKELKYKIFRIYFLVEGHKIKFYTEKELVNTLMHFVRRAHKKHQQKIIQEIKEILITIGPEGFT